MHKLAHMRRDVSSGWASQPREERGGYGILRTASVRNAPSLKRAPDVRRKVDREPPAALRGAESGRAVRARGRSRDRHRLRSLAITARSGASRCQGGHSGHLVFSDGQACIGARRAVHVAGFAATTFARLAAHLTRWRTRRGVNARGANRGRGERGRAGVWCLGRGRHRRHHRWLTPRREADRSDVLRRHFAVRDQPIAGRVPRVARENFNLDRSAAPRLELEPP